MTPEQIANAIVAAFDVDRRLPRVAKPKAPGNSHPTVYRSPELRAEIEAARKFAWIKDDPAPVRPSPAEIATMESTFARLLRVAAADREAYEALRAWAARMAGGKRSIRSIAAALEISPMQLLRRKDRALRLLAA